MMPTTFFAKRKWASFLNMIVFTDRFGKEFGYVQSWFIDWKNPFGYPGASFYLKALPSQPRQGVWRLDPTKGTYGWAAPTPAPEGAEGEGLSEQDIWEQKQAYMRRHGTNSYDVENQAFLSHWYGNTENRLLAYITGQHSDQPFGEPFKDHMYISDCRDKKKMEAHDGSITVHHAGKDAQFYTKRRNTENLMVISDFSTPTIELVRVGMKEPCWPFPPFCAQMGMFNWFLYGNEWEGQIVQPGYNQTVGNGFLGIQMTDGAATDMRFLALYSSYQFSNTRWSPLMLLLWHLAVISCCCGCCRCCFFVGPAARKKAEEEYRSALEEREKLMKTMEAEDKKETEGERGWACGTACGRGRTVAPTESKGWF